MGRAERAQQHGSSNPMSQLKQRASWGGNTYEAGGGREHRIQHLPALLSAQNSSEDLAKALICHAVSILAFWFKLWFSKCGPWWSLDPLTGNSLEMQILKFYPILAMSETLRWVPSIHILTRIPSDSDAYESLHTSVPKGKLLLGFTPTQILNWSTLCPKCPKERKATSSIISSKDPRQSFSLENHQHQIQFNQNNSTQKARDTLHKERRK